MGMMWPERLKCNILPYAKLTYQTVELAMHFR